MNANPADTKTVLIACPQCHTLVRVPADRLGQEPKCARCKSNVISDAPITLDAQAFDTHVRTAQFPVLVDFWAQWCGPCRMMAPVLDRAAADLKTRLQIGKVDTDQNQALAAQFGIRSIPTLILFRDGKEIGRLAGATDYATLTRWLAQYSI